jgi:hypothetical protein
MASPWKGTFIKTAYVFAQILRPSGRTFVLDRRVMDRTPEHTSPSRFRYDPQTGVVSYFDDYGKLLAAKPVTLH